MKSKEHNRGFTLVELSIVLVIIGLIVSGVLVGRDLIETSNRRHIISDMDRYKAAFYTFKNKYGDVPGDMLNASTVFGAGFANGNKDLTIGMGKYGGAGSYSEWFGAWQQLAAAGMVEGGYDGSVAYPASSCRTAGKNVPGSPINDGVYELADNSENVSGSEALRNLADILHFQGNLLWLISASGSWCDSHFRRGPILTPEQGSWIESKVDDGKPLSGGLFTLNAGNESYPATLWKCYDSVNYAFTTVTTATCVLAAKL